MYETSSYACPDSYPTPNPNGLGLVAGPAQGGSFKQTFTKAGTYYFVCQVDACYFPAAAAADRMAQPR